ncbi:MAG: hydroxyacid dehydrogenase [Rhodospirillales bacterium]|nr:hydroxyacid dehydrogenase [Rhodospirillales bacterium]
MLNVFLTHAPDALKNYYGTRALDALGKIVRVRRNETGGVLDTAAFIAAAAGSDLVVADRNTPVEAAFFENCPGLIAVHRGAVDHRNIDVEAASHNGVLVTNASPGFVPSVTELIIGMMIDLARSVSFYTAAYHAMTPPPAHMGRQLAGSTLGIIGYGSIGRQLAAIACAMDMRVCVLDPYQTITDKNIEQVSWQEILATSDFLACLAVATAETENLMDRAAFQAMKSGSFFINVSRGNLVDEAALFEALTHGPLAGAALDVGRAEDQKPSPRLAALSNVIATPHVGGQTPPAIEFQALETVEQVRALVSGKVPHNALNADQAHRLHSYLENPSEN